MPSVYDLPFKYNEAARAYVVTTQRPNRSNIFRTASESHHLPR